MGKEKTSYEVLVNREYKKLRADKLSIGLLMMVKNENKRIKVSLDSVTEHVDCFIIFDTGSTDNTVDIIKEHCEENQINLYLIQGEFVNFSTSRNVSLSYADTIDNLDFILLLDTNDELRGGKELRKYAEKQRTTNTTAYLLQQEWWSGKSDKYYNVRFVKPRKGWRYMGSVHEYMKDTSIHEGEEGPPVVKIQEDIILYQDRTRDDDKSEKRFVRDKVLLLQDYKQSPKDTRTLFYLAQTCACLNHNEEAFFYYKLRSQLEGFQEEKFHSILRCGDISIKLKHNWSDTLGWYMMALEHSDRVEPLLKIAEHYKTHKKWLLSFTFLQLACNLEYPTHSILFVDNHAYEYTRWHLMGVVAYYCGNISIGKYACTKAIEFGLNKELDNKNLQFYIDKEKELIKIPKPVDDLKESTKKQFITQTMIDLHRSFPRMKNKQILKIANTKWKNRNSKTK